MPRRIPFRQADVSRALKGARDAGLPVSRVEIGRDGKITMIAGGSAQAAEDTNPWDEVLEDADQERAS